MITDAQGRAVFVLEPGNYTATVTHPQYRTTTQDILGLQEGETRNVTITILKKEGTVIVQVLDNQGNPIPGADVTVVVKIP